LDDSSEIISTLDQIVTSLDLIESRVDDILQTVSGLEAQAAVTAEDLAAIRRDIDRLEPGVI
jgi:DNA integrity scanning protein DisA with diadenylate cyclase activity